MNINKLDKVRLALEHAETNSRGLCPTVNECELIDISEKIHLDQNTRRKVKWQEKY